MKELRTPLHLIKNRCPDCNHGFGKQLDIKEGLVTQEDIDYFIFQALFHEEHHPDHNVEVTIYQNAPETIEEI